jgi:hypothetical protein
MLLGKHIPLHKHTYTSVISMYTCHLQAYACWVSIHTACNLQASAAGCQYILLAIQALVCSMLTCILTCRPAVYSRSIHYQQGTHHYTVYFALCYCYRCYRYLMSMLHSRCSSEYNKMIPSRQEMYARVIKEQQCYVADDFVQEQTKKGHFTVSTCTFQLLFLYSKQLSFDVASLHCSGVVPELHLLLLLSTSH